MTRKRVIYLIDLVEKVNALCWATIQASITISADLTGTASYSIHVYDSRREKSLSMYYETDPFYKTYKHPSKKSIICLYDKDLKKGERFLESIISWQEKEGNNDQELG